MVSSGTQTLLSFIGWTLVPDFATKQLLSLLYRSPSIFAFLPSALAITPQPLGSPQFRKHYAFTFAFVVLGYLLYTMVQSARAMPPNFYEILGVPPSVDENGLKLAFRQFAKRHHPDRPEVGEEGTELFMMVRDAFEALKDPVVRFAYDRFGPNVLLWKHCKTTREFLHYGLMQSTGFHIVSGAALLFWSTIGQPSPVSFWRYMLYASLFATELALILSPSSLAPLSLSTDDTQPPRTLFNIFFPNRITHQHILFLHQLFLFCSVALSRVAPKLFPTEDDPRAEKAILERSLAVVSVADREASLMLHTELHSVLPPQNTSPHPHNPSLARMYPLDPQRATELVNSLTEEMQDIVIEANLKKDVGPLRSAWEAAVRALLAVTGYDANGAKTMNFWERNGTGEVQIDVDVQDDTSDEVHGDDRVEESMVLVGNADGSITLVDRTANSTATPPRISHEHDMD